VYHEKDILTMHSARFFRLAERCSAYPGVIRARALAEESQRTRGSQIEQEPRGVRPDATGAAQRYNLRSRGGEVASVASSRSSYLAERLKGAP